MDNLLKKKNNLNKIKLRINKKSPDRNQENSYKMMNKALKDINLKNLK